MDPYTRAPDVAHEHAAGWLDSLEHRPVPCCAAWAGRGSPRVASGIV
ncbi:hypothetical protein [Serinicoccus sp. LYQ131]